MSKYATRKATATGRAETLRRKEARRSKYAAAPALTLPTSGGRKRAQ